MGTTYGIILQRPPYNWPSGIVSYINCGQIPIALVCFPLLGYASDRIIQSRAQRNGGIHEPETRLITIFVPVTIGIVAAFFYGQGATFSDYYSWTVYLWTISGYFFAFVGVNIVIITYLLESYPDRAGPVLIIISALRGVIGFLVSLNVAYFINEVGYDGTFTAFAILTGVLGLLTVLIFNLGKRIRIATAKWTTSTATSISTP
jgi:MFS family permease